MSAVSGKLCPKGEAYVTQELTDPKRTIAASVRLTSAIPKERIFDVMHNRCALTAPVRIGDVVLHDVLGLGSDVIVTKNVDRG